MNITPGGVLMRGCRLLAGLASALVIMLAAASAAGAATGAPAQGPVPPVPVPPPVTWGPCNDPFLQYWNAECGYVTVPLNYSDPSGPTIQLAVSRIAHTSSASDYKGAILMNPGGPGAPGIDLPTGVLYIFNQVDNAAATTGEYDWIGFDPRGAGSSIPAISCDPNYLGPDRPSYVPSSLELLDTWLSRSRGYADACASQSAEQTALLHNMTTVDSALDMESIREALGQPQISYYGYSYGTYLGQVYATLFPSHLRRLILDSNIDPRSVWYQANLNQDAPFQRNLDLWFAWLAQYDSVYHLGSTEPAVAQTFDSAEAALAADPAGGVIGPDEWVDTFLVAGYGQPNWIPWGQAFSDWVNHHDDAAANELIGLYDAVDTPGNDNLFAGYLGVECSDAPWPTNWNIWSHDNWRIFRVAPFATWDNAWFNAPCIDWPAPASRPVQVDGRGVDSALLIDETLDAATPFEGSLEVRKLFPNSVLLAEPGGTTHAETPTGQDPCVDGTILDYLATGALPARDDHMAWDKTCPPPPTPDPTATAAAAAVTRGSARGLATELGRRMVRGGPVVGRP